MKSGLETHKVGAWLSGKGPHSSIVISSRIRLARNIADYPFLPKASREEQAEIITALNKAIAEISVANGRNLVDMDEVGLLEAQFLLERHLISPDFIKSGIKRGFFAAPDETLSLMANEEDHLRLQVLGSGLSLSSIYGRIRDTDEKISSLLGYSFHQRYGFLTACPTNVGTGMRASVLVHLPGLVLTKELDKVLRGVLQLGLAVRGTHGEGTETKGYLFQISNQRTLGQSEEEITATLVKMAEQLLSYELDARSYLSAKAGLYVQDKVFRSLGILKYARTLSSSEALNLVSALRLGCEYLEGADTAKLNRLMILSQPANLQMFFGGELAPQDRDAKRAELLRQAFADVGP